MKIAFIGRTETTRKFIMPFLKALTQAGHAVVGISNKDSGKLIEKVKKFEPDICVTTSTELKHALHYKKDWLMEQIGIPYVSIWFQTPLRNLWTLKTLTSSLHAGMFIPDSTDVAELRKLGFQDSHYLSISWWVDTDYFKPMPPSRHYQHDVAWDCSFHPLSFIFSNLEKKYPDEQMKAIIDNAKKNFKKHIGTYVNPFEFLRKTTNLDVWSEEFQQIQSDLLFLQRSIDRNYILRMLKYNDIGIDIYGGFTFDHNRLNLNSKIDTLPGITIHDYIDTYEELPKLYASSKIMLSRMMYPSGVHDRLFCAAATKGFVLSEWKDDAAKAFEPGKEIIMYKDIKELPGLIKYYLKHEDERKRLAEAAHKRFMAEHTPLHRAREFVEIVKGLI